MEGYDIIGDVHGCSTRLEELLVALGYRPNDWTGAYWHPSRRAVFVGDLIDRGPEQLAVLDTVKTMVDSGSAHVVMGNHEFNAIGFATERHAGSGDYLRQHTDKNRRQHQEFLRQVTGARRAHYVSWFKTLPLWLDFGGFRVVHACWHEPSLKLVERELASNRFNALDQFVRASAKGDRLYEAVEILLKGPEINLVAHGAAAYRDKDGHRREHARVRWWHEDATTLRDFAEVGETFTTENHAPYPPLPDREISAADRSYTYTGRVPVFYGHYWRTGEPTHLLDWTARTACVDFSAVRGGTLVAYRWSGESQIRVENYVLLNGS